MGVFQNVWISHGDQMTLGLTFSAAGKREVVRTATEEDETENEFHRIHLNNCATRSITCFMSPADMNIVVTKQMSKHDRRVCFYI